MTIYYDVSIYLCPQVYSSKSRLFVVSYERKTNHISGSIDFSRDISKKVLVWMQLKLVFEV